MCNDPTPPGDDEAPKPGTNAGGETPFWSHTIPMARPVALAAPGPLIWARPVEHARTLGRWRAAIELILLLLTVLVAIVGASYIAETMPFNDPRWQALLTTALVALILMVACFVMMRIDGQSLSAIGWRWDRWPADVALGIGATILTYFLLFCAGVVLVILRPDLMEGPSEAQQAIEANLPRMSLRWLTLLMVFVAIWEEVVFRGFLLTRLHAIVRRWWLAVPLGAFVFALGHVYEGALATIVVGGLGVLLGILFVWRQSLVPVIVLHFLFNSVAMLILRLGSQTWE